MVPQPDNDKTLFLCHGMLAQLVQSIALTGRGSLVRVQYIPHRKPLNAAFFILMVFLKPLLQRFH